MRPLDRVQALQSECKKLQESLGTQPAVAAKLNEFAQGLDELARELGPTSAPPAQRTSSEEDDDEDEEEPKTTKARALPRPRKTLTAARKRKK